MPELKPNVRTSLEVGYPEGTLPLQFVRYRGRVTRSIGAMPEFPFENAQFEVVMLEGGSVSRASVKEAHRVLRPDGRLFFIVDEKTSRQPGYTMPEIYALVRDGFDIRSVVRPPWWRFGRRGRTFTICAVKKNWRTYKSLTGNGSLPLAPFEDRA